MRLWTVHPRHLDPAGLVALWREALLAQAVLLGRTRGYTRHPQLQRFKAAADPEGCIARYLRAVADDHQAALAVGIPLQQIWAIVWSVAGGAGMPSDRGRGGMLR
jgi:hypothetical protein